MATRGFSTTLSNERLAIHACQSLKATRNHYKQDSEKHEAERRMRTSAGDGVDLLDSPIAHSMRLALKALRAILGVDASLRADPRNARGLPMVLLGGCEGRRVGGGHGCLDVDLGLAVAQVDRASFGAALDLQSDTR